MGKIMDGVKPSNLTQNPNLMIKMN